uniref:Uncharacterized protein n=1 Tax=Medicago truncatula TaxID=3880 RepID=I3SVP3_MEDTR|nr:unknown [Medicago truncatula]
MVLFTCLCLQQSLNRSFLFINHLSVNQKLIVLSPITSLIQGSVSEIPLKNHTLRKISNSHLNLPLLIRISFIISKINNLKSISSLLNIQRE